MICYLFPLVEVDNVNCHVQISLQNVLKLNFKIERPYFLHGFHHGEVERCIAVTIGEAEKQLNKMIDQIW